MQPYYEHGGIAIYHGDMRDLLFSLPPIDCILADPPYNETSLRWDQWPAGWLEAAAACLTKRGSMWCFGTLRMFMDRAGEFSEAGWHLAQDVAGKDVDVLWEKHNGSGFHNDRFRRVHEQVAHFYPRSSRWADVYTDPQYTNDAKGRTINRKATPAHWHGELKRSSYTSYDGGPRLMRSIIEVRSMHGSARNETEKPVGLIAPLVRYSCPSEGLLLEPFMGSGPGLSVARMLGLRAIGIDVRENQCEIAARDMMQQVLPL